MVRAFFGRPIYLSRNGAAALAVEAVFDKLGGIPKSLELLSYRTSKIIGEKDLPSMEQGSGIEEVPDTLYLGFIWHIFEIDADGTKFRIAVDGKKVDIISYE